MISRNFLQAILCLNVTLLLCRVSEGPLHRLLSDKFVMVVGMDGWSLSCALKHAYTELSSFADVSKVISCETALFQCCLNQSVTWEKPGFFKRVT